MNALQLTLTAIFEPAKEGGYTCHFAELPEVFSEGETLAAAKANLHDALQLVLSYHRDEAVARAEGPSGRVQEVYELTTQTA